MIAIKKQYVFTIIGVMALVSGILYGLPYGKVYQIISALQGQDRERLAQYIDFSQVRMGLKEQVRATVSASLRNNNLDKIRQAMTAQVLDKAVDQMITPEGLSSFFSKNLAGLMGDADKPSNRQAVPETYLTAKIFMTVLWQAHFAYASASEFAVLLKFQQDQSIRFLLKRAGLDWRLSRIDLAGTVGNQMK